MWTGPFAFIGTQEVLIIAGMIVLIFGGAKIPQLARGFGEGIREFRTSVDGTADDSAPAAKAASDQRSITAAE